MQAKELGKPTDPLTGHRQSCGCQPDSDIASSLLEQHHDGALPDHAGQIVLQGTQNARKTLPKMNVPTAALTGHRTISPFPPTRQRLILTQAPKTDAPSSGPPELAYASRAKFCWERRKLGFHARFHLACCELQRQPQTATRHNATGSEFNGQAMIQNTAGLFCKQNGRGLICPRVTLLRQKSVATHTSSDTASEKISKLPKLTHERLTKALLRRPLPSYAARLVVYEPKEQLSH